MTSYVFSHISAFFLLGISTQTNILAQDQKILISLSRFMTPSKNNLLLQMSVHSLLYPAQLPNESFTCLVTHKTSNCNWSSSKLLPLLCTHTNIRAGKFGNGFPG